MKQSVGAKTLATPTPVWLVGTYDEGGVPNIMTAAWGGICCSQPPCLAVSLRRATYSYAAIEARRAFTISIPARTQAAQTDYVGTVSGRNGNKFADCDWTAVGSDLVDAPYVDEVPLVVECRLLHIHDLGLHTQFVGEIVDVKADEAVIGAKGYPDITKVSPMIWDTAHRGYYSVGEFLGSAWEIGKTVATERIK
ncbi:flavin reductase family protein [Geobacter sp. AOG2]|uniref:flavin reductase family protein n=1 Tax=Geobacter sp. AOG2 TaxID=1566347 RepID=UPI001CC565A2|nr:flavin reductase family protein [Geobacter sp. AOG2]GFE60562.1 flavodoxin [Geobacter sp. AOG2]